jgi:hypothetical protein
MGGTGHGGAVSEACGIENGVRCAERGISGWLRGGF